MKFYSMDSSSVLDELKAVKEGLSTAEAEKRLAEHGKNKLAEGKKESLIVKFFKQMMDPMIIVLIVAAALSGITAFWEGESFADVFIILFVVILNAVLGVIQESKAEEAIEALKTMTAANSKVLRDGKLVVIHSEDLVPGDIVLLEAGDAVPADARILECASMKVEESALTGESVPVVKKADTLSSEKDVPLGDRKNMVYMGSTVVYGRGTVVVCGTGMNTEMGKIADALTLAQEEQTPLQKKLAGLSKILTWLVLGICVVMFAVGVIKAGEFTPEVIIDTFMVAVSLAVAAIPEGLAAVVTIVLSIGVTKMAKRNAVIRKLTAVETLGCAQIICSDKTGTLTQNKMTVVENHSDNDELLAKAMCLCTDAEIDEDAGEAVGEPTEAALVNYAYKVNLNKNQLKKIAPRVGEAPFDSMRKMMSTVHSIDGGFVQYTKGAPDEILKRCTSILTENGVVPMTEAHRDEIRKTNKGMADKALRVLAGAYKEYTSKLESFEPSALEEDMIFIGLSGMIDPVRPEVKLAVEECKGAGIRAIMITGDHIDTAVAIASELGILDDPSQAIMGQELDKLSDEELDKVIDKYSVYARVQPEHKVRIVNAWKNRGKVTAMTGDGVNDAPSIKSADIGIGMGITGTDVTKNVADMILADDNFATIVAAVGEGRKIYANIRKAIQFLLSSNLAEVISVFVATILGFTVLKPVHMLWINLITDSLPALALGMEHGEADSMKKAPRDPKAGIFAGGVGLDVAYQGAFVAILTLVSYFIGHFLETRTWAFNIESGHGMTMAFLTMSLAEIFQSFNMRSQRGSIFAMKKQNKWLLGAAALALVLTTVVIEIPFLARAFEFEVIGFEEYGIAFALGISIIPLVEIVKAIQRMLSKTKNK
ncbi:MAG: cation-translocating P-type ATPase [Clostridia bacterium]|nr:cation-translocating P-type ATPase [Clostridia bacterium]